MFNRVIVLVLFGLLLVLEVTAESKEVAADKAAANPGNSTSGGDDDDNDVYADDLEDDDDGQNTASGGDSILGENVVSPTPDEDLNLNATGSQESASKAESKPVDIPNVNNTAVVPSMNPPVVQPPADGVPNDENKATTIDENHVQIQSDNVPVFGGYNTHPGYHIEDSPADELKDIMEQSGTMIQMIKMIPLAMETDENYLFHHLNYTTLEKQGAVGEQIIKFVEEDKKAAALDPMFKNEPLSEPHILREGILSFKFGLKDFEKRLEEEMQKDENDKELKEKIETLLDEIKEAYPKIDELADHFYSVIEGRHEMDDSGETTAATENIEVATNSTTLPLTPEA